ncbi:MAG TPA: sucrase ferredoxin [Nocardioides sp.]|nr:sucrase ferredoxin [Nocardioides sp.]
MTQADERYRCAVASLARAEPAAGSATHVRTWLLLEHSGPWGNDALLDARLPEGLGPQLKQLAQDHRAKVLLARRARAGRDPQRLTVFAAHTDPARPRVERGTVADLREVLDLDLAGFRAGGSTGLDPHDGTLFCVCTNGRHDACCAEFGRPVAMALDEAFPEQAWEVSHVGGDRFAANMVVLPEGLYYGRLDPASGRAVAEAHLSGRLDLDHLRGRSSYPMAVQAGEIRLRRDLGLLAIADLALLRTRRDGDVVVATWAAGGATYDVAVRTVADPAVSARLTCKAHRDNPVPRHEVVSIEPGR